MSNAEDTKNAGNLEQIRRYRDWLVQAEQKAQEDFDKTVLALSGGGIGVSLTYIKDVLHDTLKSPWLITVAWFSWALSILCVLASFYCSHLALRYCIKQVDEKTVYIETPGGRYAKLTASLNAVGGVLFVVGMAFVIAFVAWNVR